MIAQNTVGEPTVRGIALERLIRVAQALQRVRFGLDITDLVQELADEMGSHWSTRTVHRDLQLLERLGLVSVQHGRARWIGSGGFFEQPAVAAGESMDRRCQLHMRA